MSPISFCGFLFFMNRRPPRSTRTDTLFPYTTLFRSHMEAANRYLDIIDNNIDVAIRTREYEPDSNITIRRLCETRRILAASPGYLARNRSEEHTSELQSLMRISYAVFCLKKKTPQHIRIGDLTNCNHTYQRS